MGHLANWGSRSWCLEAEFQNGILTMSLQSLVLLGQTALTSDLNGNTKSFIPMTGLGPWVTPFLY